MAVRRKDERVDLVPTIEILHRYLTESLCLAVFERERTAEREREWTLHALATFWTEVILRAPRSLSQVLSEVSQAHGFMRSPVATSRQAFFQRCQDLDPKFFAALYREFTRRVLEEAPPVFASSLGVLRERFPEVYVIDGSKLDAIRHRLKILWNERAVVLPGAVLALYDLFRGITREVHFTDDAAASEHVRMREVLPSIPKGTLLVGDRLFAMPQVFQALGERGLHGLFRRNKLVRLRTIRTLRKVRRGKTYLRESLVEAGSAPNTPRRLLRRIQYREGKIARDLLTDVLDPKTLSAEEALSLYPLRWSVERLFFDLKDVLNLHRVYAGSPNAVAMQVYAAALVHTAMRIAQARIARKQGIQPEKLSPAKLFPRLAAASEGIVKAELYFKAVCQANPRSRLKKPRWQEMAFAWTTLAALLVETRRGKRRHRRFCPARRQWKSLKHVRGYPK